MDRKCKTCRYSEVSPDVEDAIFCKRYAPRPGIDFEEWPIVWENDWCGEFEPEEQDE